MVSTIAREWNLRCRRRRRRRRRRGRRRRRRCRHAVNARNTPTS